MSEPQTWHDFIEAVHRRIARGTTIDEVTLMRRAFKLGLSVDQTGFLLTGLHATAAV
jgi:hypothetical protein